MREERSAGGWALTPVLTRAVVVDMLLALLISPFLPAITSDIRTDPALVWLPRV